MIRLEGLWKYIMLLYNEEENFNAYHKLSDNFLAQVKDNLLSFVNFFKRFFDYYIRFYIFGIGLSSEGKYKSY